LSSSEDRKFGQRLRQARESKGYSQGELAVLAGMQPSAISHFEADRRSPSFDNLRRLADALSVTTDFLLGRVSEPSASGPEAARLYRSAKTISKGDLETLARFAEYLSAKQPVAAFTNAEAVATRYGQLSLPIDPFLIADRAGIVLRPSDADEPGVWGSFLKVGDNFGIMYPTHIKSEGFIRFTVAHELGHYFLPGHAERFFQNGSVTKHTAPIGVPSKDPIELEADDFAASLLMPERLFKEAMRELGVGLQAVKKLAERCRTSLTATAIRYALLSPDPLAVVVSCGPKVEYCFVSESLSTLHGVVGKKLKGQPVPGRSWTKAFNDDPKKVSGTNEVAGTSQLDDWFDEAPSIEMGEDVAGLGDYGKTLTVLSSKDSLPDPEGAEEPEDEEIE